MFLSLGLGVCHLKKPIARDCELKLDCCMISTGSMAFSRSMNSGILTPPFFVVNVVAMSLWFSQTRLIWVILGLSWRVHCIWGVFTSSWLQNSESALELVQITHIFPGSTESWRPGRYPAKTPVGFVSPLRVTIASLCVLVHDIIARVYTCQSTMLPHRVFFFHTAKDATYDVVQIVRRDNLHTIFHLLLSRVF